MRYCGPGAVPEGEAMGRIVVGSRWFSAVCVAFVLSPASSDARTGGPFGLGVALGDPTGVSAKLFLGETNAVDAVVGLSLDNQWIHFHADYLMHFPLKWSRQDFRLYAGIGGKLVADGDGDDGHHGTHHDVHDHHHVHYDGRGRYDYDHAHHHHHGHLDHGHRGHEGSDHSSHGHGHGHGHDDEGDLRLGVRIPLGIAWHPRKVPIDVFLELVPGLVVIPATALDFDFALGARFYF